MESSVFTDPPSDLYIGGKWLPSADGGRFEVRDPATDAVIVVVANGTVEDGIDGVQAAHDASPEWAATPPRDRAESSAAPSS